MVKLAMPGGIANSYEIYTENLAEIFFDIFSLEKVVQLTADTIMAQSDSGDIHHIHYICRCQNEEKSFLP